MIKLFPEPTPEELEYHELRKKKWRAYNNRPEVKSKRKEYWNSPKVKERLKEYWKQPEVIERKLEQIKSPEIRKQKREYYYFRKSLDIEIKHSYQFVISDVLDELTRFH